MKAFFIDEPGKFSFGEVEKPEVKDGEVLLQLKRVGYCGSDLNTYRGRNPLVKYPRIPGHEIGAYVAEIGAGVPEELKVGDLVTVVPYTNCGKCGGCRRNRLNACENNETLGVQREGTMTEFVSVPYEKVLKLETNDPNLAALIEPLAVGFHAASRGKPAFGEKVLIFGCGMVGLGAMLKAVRSGSEVIAVDIDDDKLKLAKTLGVQHTINSSIEDLDAKVAELTAGFGPDMVLEAAGVETLFIKAVDLVTYAGKVVYVGYTKGPVTYETKKFLLKELDIMGSRGSTAVDFQDVIDMVNEGEFDVTGLITKVVPFEKAGDAIAEWDSNPSAVTKFIIDIG
ncbi:MAG: zinc-binding alcohol dehydrogenase family protein [Spirochaetales bacterium]|uniref:Zinc-binding alcohol dehydrogenase family protein n=1 Tax=Candidatus Thalassospirochaeta sargassi TaxID=3119039 RepID=A0AAJ1ICL1_9SPIO|nr:zinc-binding alcohol dehydrogenase family protein [Spirochaetales bacterium]